MWKEMGGRVWNMAKTSAKLAADKVAEKGADALNVADETAHKALDQAQELGQKAATEIGKITESAKVVVEIAADVAGDKVRTLTEQVSEKATAAAQMAKEQAGMAATVVKDKLQEASAAGERLLENATYRTLQDYYGPDWLPRLVESLDYPRIADQVAHRKNEHPGAGPEDMADRAVKDKALGGKPLSDLRGLLDRPVPDALRDFLFLTAAQAETILEVAGAYGLDEAEPGRKGEILLVLGMASGAENETLELARQAMAPEEEKAAGLVMQTFARQVGLALSRKAFMRQLPVLGILIGESLTYSSLMLTGEAARRFYAEQKQAGEVGSTESTAPNLAAYAVAVTNLANTQTERQRKHYQVLVNAALSDRRLSIPERQFLDSFLKEAGFSEEERQAWLVSTQTPEPLETLMLAITDPQERQTLYRQVAALTELEGPRNPAAQAFLDRLAAAWGIATPSR